MYMFIKKITKRNKDTGGMYLTYRLVRSYRLDNKPRHETIIDLGTIPNIELSKHKQLADRIEELLYNPKTIVENIVDENIEFYAQYFYNEIIKKKNNSVITKINVNENQSEQKRTEDETQTEQNKPEDENDVISPDFQEVDLNSFDTVESTNIGGEWLCFQAFEEIGLSRLFSETLKFSTKEYQQAINCLIGRLLYPGSDLRTSLFLNENSGIKHLFDDKERSAIIERKSLIKISEKFYQNKETIERQINRNIQDVLQYQPKLLLYDLTNSHFEGRMQKSKKAQYGRNKQKRNDCPQVSMAMAVDEFGFPQYSSTYEGNISEPGTLKDLINNISEKLKWTGNTKPIIVIDAGISSEDNLIDLYNEGYHYICVSKSEHRKYRKLVIENDLTDIFTASGAKLQVQSFDNELKYFIDKDAKVCKKKKNKKSEENQEIVIEKIIKEKLLYVKTELKKIKEDGILNGKRLKIEKELISLQKSLTNPNVDKKTETIYQRLGRIKERHKMVQSCYKISLISENEIVTALNWEYIERNKKETDSGSYFIRSSITTPDEQSLWKLYRTIGEVEDVFRTLKSDLLMRGIFHQTDKNIDSHLFVCVIAVTIVNFIRYKLRKSKITYCWSEIVRIMSTQKCNINTIKRKDGATVILKKCSRANHKVNEIYKAMNYKNIPFFLKKYIVKN